jgi:ABC-type nitrate/sulfonate/bicarbonate transport system permease component
MKRFFPLFFGLFIFFTLEIILQHIDIPPYIIPLPSQVVNAILSDWVIILQSTQVTAAQWIIGVFLAILLSFLFSYGSFKYEFMEKLLNPLLITSQSIPYLVLSPLLMIWLGLGMAPKIVLVVLTCFFPIALVLQNDLKTARQEYASIVKILRIKEHKAFFNIYLPHTLPSFFNALKISASYSFGSAALAELMGSEKGLGIYLLRSQITFQTNKVIAAVIVIVTLSLTSAAIVSFIQKKVVFWKIPKF